MPSRSSITLCLLLVLSVIGSLNLGAAAEAQTVQVSDLPRMTHIHGLAVDPADPDYLFIATHHGLFRAGPDGAATRISIVQDFMGFMLRPDNSGVLLASGHPADGGNLGFIVSEDGGKTWKQLSPGLNGPVDFHQLTVSPAAPNVVYGAYGSLQVSRDGGATWSDAGPLPEKLIDLAASARSPDTVYAATEDGLRVSHDAGSTWEMLVKDSPVTMVEVGRDGSLYAFAYGQGLLRSPEGGELSIVAEDFGDDYILHLAIDETQPKRLFSSNRHGQVLESSDGGKTWKAYGAR